MTVTEQEAFVRAVLRASRSAALPPGPDSFTAGVADLEPGAWLGLHSHEQAEIYYVFQGEVLLQLDGAEHPLRAGSAVFIPGGATHGVRNAGSTSARLFYTLAAGSFDEVEYVFVGQVHGSPGRGVRAEPSGTETGRPPGASTSVSMGTPVPQP